MFAKKKKALFISAGEVISWILRVSNQAVLTLSQSNRLTAYVVCVCLFVCLCLCVHSGIWWRMEWYVLVLMLSLPPSIHADCSSQCQKCAQQILNSDVALSSLVRWDTVTQRARCAERKERKNWWWPQFLALITSFFYCVKFTQLYYYYYWLLVYLFFLNPDGLRKNVTS